jgi:hypothetical protein
MVEYDGRAAKLDNNGAGVGQSRSLDWIKIYLLKL